MKQPKYIELLDKLKNEFPGKLNICSDIHPCSNYIFMAFFSKCILVLPMAPVSIGFDLRRKEGGRFEIILWQWHKEATTKFLKERKLSRYIKKDGE